MKSPYHLARVYRVPEPSHERPLTLSQFLTIGRPWEVLARRMGELALSGCDLAERSGLPVETIEGLLSGSLPFGYRVCNAIGPVLGPDPSYWVMVQSIEDARRAIWR